MFWFFGHEACGILAPRAGIKPVRPALESEVLTTGPPGKSHLCYFDEASQLPCEEGTIFIPILQMNN